MARVEASQSRDRVFALMCRLAEGAARSEGPHCLRAYFIPYASREAVVDGPSGFCDPGLPLTASAREYHKGDAVAVGHGNKANVVGHAIKGARFILDTGSGG